MAIPVLMILATAFIVMLLYSSRRNESTAPVRRTKSSALRIWSRRLMPVCGAVLLAAVILGTLDDVSRTYAAAESPDTTEIPCVPTAAIVEDGDAGEYELLVNVLLGVQQGDSIRCLDSDSTVLPAKGGFVDPVEFRKLGASYAVYPSITPVDPDAPEAGLRVEGQYEFRAPSMSGSGGMSARATYGKASVIAHRQLTTSELRPFSLRTAPRQPIVAALIVQRIQPGAERISRPVHEVLAEVGGLPAIEWPPPAPAGASSHIPALQYFIHIGLTSLVLIASCWLFAMYFRHRMLAVAIVMAVLLLITSAVDGWMVGLHRDRLLDEEQPVAVRCVAADHLGYSYFYGDRAHDALREVIGFTRLPNAIDSSARMALRVEHASRY